MQLTSSTPAILALLALAPTAQAQWTVTNLHPAGALESYAVGTSDGQQVGTVQWGPNVFHASIWNGTAASLLNINPVGQTDSRLSGNSGGQQVGIIWPNGGTRRASLWNGTSASWTSLHPPGAGESTVNGVSNGQQVGHVNLGVVNRASLWSGTVASHVDLHPHPADISIARAISGVEQVGQARWGGVFRAILWNGTGASWIDLSPPFATESVATGVFNGQQVGYATIGGVQRASMWSGTAASWVDLNPAGANYSEASATFGGRQAGSAVFPGTGGSSATIHAGIWSGSSASFEDLSAVLPAEFSQSRAKAIWSDADFIYVAGYAFNAVAFRSEAMLWSRPHGIDYFQISKVSRFTQSSVAAPTTVDSWQMAGWLQHTPYEVVSASISFDAPLPTTVPMIQANPSLHLYYSSVYLDQLDMDLDYPSTTYTFTVDRGAGPESEFVFMPVDLYCPEIPTMTGDTYDRLQNYDVAQDFDLEINGFTPPPGTNEAHTTVQIDSGGVVFTINVSSNDTLVTIPAGTLLPGASSEILIQYSCSVETLNAGFGTASSYATFLRDTTATFTTSNPLEPGTNYCTAVPNSTGAAAAMSASGSDSVAMDDLVLRCSDLPLDGFGFFLTGQTQDFIQQPGASQGNLCLGGVIGRYVAPGQVQNSGAFGQVALAVQLSQHPTPAGLVQVVPGETWHFTYWYRDFVAGLVTSNFSDGYTIAFQ